MLATTAGCRCGVLGHSSSLINDTTISSRPLFLGPESVLTLLMHTVTHAVALFAWAERSSARVHTSFFFLLLRYISLQPAHAWLVLSMRAVPASVSSLGDSLTLWDTEHCGLLSWLF